MTSLDDPDPNPRSGPLARPGLFVTFEGGEGAGKSTQIARLSLRLREKRYRVVATREPGGTPGAEAVRHVILSGAAEPLGKKVEALLFAAARADHVDQVIRPAVARGEIVLCDRFLDSTRAYQGGVGGAEPAYLGALERIALGGLMPDLTLVFDIEPAEGLRRARERSGAANADRFEREDLSIHETRRQAFLAIARAEPERCRVIDAWDTVDQVEHAVTDAFFATLDAKIAAQATAP